jgi:hypothetical protein
VRLGGIEREHRIFKTQPCAAKPWHLSSAMVFGRDVKLSDTKLMHCDACHNKGTNQLYYHQYENARIDDNAIRFSIDIEEFASYVALRMSVEG